MQLKKPSLFGQWVFYIGGKEDSDNPELEVETVRVPLEGSFNAKHKLVNAVITELTNLATQGATGYMDSIKEEAASYGKKPKEFLEMLVEHQICVRAGSRTGLCWNTTLGDKIHSVTEAVDDLVEKIAPKKVKKVYAKLAKFIVPKAANAQRFSSCGGCGGGKSLKISRNNRGRAGRI